MIELIVLCLNDSPIGVYSTRALADAAALVNWKQLEPRWKDQNLHLGQSLIGMTGYAYTRYFYHQRKFTVDTEAQ